MDSLPLAGGPCNDHAKILMHDMGDASWNVAMAWILFHYRISLWWAAGKEVTSSSTKENLLAGFPRPNMVAAYRPPPAFAIILDS